jgi:hypothetical protein
MQLTARKPVVRRELGFDRMLSAWQRAAIHDPSKRIHLCMGRRSGKSTCCIVMALRVVLSREDALVFIVYPSRDRARSTMWPPFKRIVEAYGLKAKFNESDLSITFSETKSVVRMLGVEDVYHADRLRGTPADLYICDEAQSFRDKTLRYLIDECIGPAAGDLDAPIVLAGTACNTTTGLWFESDKRNNPQTAYSCYNATVLENQYYERWRGKGNWQELAHEFLAGERAKKGWSDTNPIYLREWMNQWKTDSTSFYYHEFQVGRNTTDRADIPDDLTYVISGDFGSRVDPTALCVLGWNSRSKNCYVVDCLKIESPTRAENICFRLKKLIDQYKPEQVIGDYAAGGTYLFDQMAERYGVLVDDAKKSKKSGTTDLINSDLHEGRIKIASDLTDLITELKTIHWDDARKGPLPSDPNDCADAFSYGWTEVYAHLYKPPEPQKTRQQIQNEELEAYFAEEDLRIQQEQDPWQLF